MRRSATTFGTTLRALAVALAATALLSACGGGSKASTKTQTDAVTTSSKKPEAADSGALGSDTGASDERSASSFTDAANKACETRANAYIAALDDLDAQYKHDSIKWAAGETALTVKVDKARLAALEDLTPPAKIRDAYNSYLGVLKDKLDLREKALQAVEDSDQSAYQAANSEDGATDDEQRSTARDAGLDACSGDALSDDDVAEIERLVKTTGTTSDPAFCTESFTPGFVFQQFGTVDDCKKAQGNPPSYSSVEVSDPYGVGDYADITVEAEPPDGSGTEKGFAVLYRQDGTWRLQSVSVQS